MCKVKFIIYYILTWIIKSGIIGSTNYKKGSNIVKHIKQFSIILLVTFIGELLNKLIPLPVPASVYGMVLMYAALLSGVIKLKDVEGAGKFLIEIMPLMFIPAGVGLLESWGVLKPVVVPFVTITIVSTVLVMVVSGIVTQKVIKRQKRKEEKK